MDHNYLLYVLEKVKAASSRKNVLHTFSHDEAEHAACLALAEDGLIHLVSKEEDESGNAHYAWRYVD